MEKTINEKRQMLPSLVTHPLTLLIATVIPNVILLVINIRSFTLISGEMEPEQLRLAYTLFGLQLVVMAMGVSVALPFLKTKNRIPLYLYWVILVSHIAFLVLFIFKAEPLIPDSLQVWILQPDKLVGAQFVGLMPATFLAALAIACFPTRFSFGADLGMSLGAALGVPFLWYLAGRLLGGIIFDADIHPSVFAIFFGFSSLVCIIGVIRLLVYIYNGLQKRGPIGQFVLILLVGVIGPIGGLLLNREIPFPVNFQSPYIYILAIANGLALLIPKFSNPKLNRISWLLQCLFFPFSLYFFICFLPWLPLSILAIIAAGAGFLILIPTILFILHLKKIVEGIESKRMIIVAIAMVLVCPAYLYVEAILDRRVLNQAIDYIYAPNYEDGDRFSGNRFVAKRTLGRMNKIKHGMYLPFLTDIYNQIVLNNLVLSDAKLKHIHKSFFGEEPEKLTVEHGWLNGFFGNSGSGGRTRLNSPPPNGVILEDLKYEHTMADSMIRTLVRLEMKNPIAIQSEYTAIIQIPDGTFVSGYWLDVEGERVPGKIFEKKTAMWVYRMIRDATRRDPGLLTYRSANLLQLRVFPFEASQTRVTEIEFLTPTGLSNVITIDGRTIDPLSSVGASESALQFSQGQGVIVTQLNAQVQKGLPQLLRDNYLHFIIDRSVHAPALEAVISQCEALAKEYPKVTHCKLTLANYEIMDVTSHEAVPIANLREYLSKQGDQLPKRGQLLVQRSIQRCLYKYHTEPQLECPLFVVVGSKKSQPRATSSNDWFGELLPDYAGYLYLAGSSSQAFRFNGESISDLEQQPVHVVSSLGQLQIIPANTGVNQSVFHSGKSGEEILCYVGDQAAFIPLAVERRETTELYSQAISGWTLNTKAIYNPAKMTRMLRTIVEKSREYQILLPSTAFIVVENSAQWEMLKRKEKKKLKGNQALDHMETPEPAWWIVLAIYLIGLLLWRYRRIFWSTVWVNVQVRR